MVGNTEIHFGNTEIRPNTAWGARQPEFIKSVTSEPDVGFDFPKRQKLLELNFLTDGNTVLLTRVMLEEGEVD